MTLAHGQTTASFVVSVLADDLPEFNESFRLSLIQVCNTIILLLVSLGSVPTALIYSVVLDDYRVAWSIVSTAPLFLLFCVLTIFTIQQVDQGLAVINSSASQFSGLIVENDNPWGTVQFERTSVNAAEDAGVIRVNIVRSNGGLGLSLWAWTLRVGATGVNTATQFISVS